MKEIFICENCNVVLNNEFSICPKCLKEKGFKVLEVEKDKRTSDMTFDEFIKYSKAIPSYESETYTDYLWDTGDASNELIESNKNLIPYTVIHEENKCWIVNGYRLANRLGYIFSEVYVEIEEGIEY